MIFVFMLHSVFPEPTYLEAADAGTKWLRDLKDLGLHNTQQEYALHIDSIYNLSVWCSFSNIMLADIHPDEYTFKDKFGREEHHSMMSEFAALRHTTGDFVDPSTLPGPPIVAPSLQEK